MGPWVSAGTASPAVGLCCRPCGYCGKQDGRGLLLWSLYSFFFKDFIYLFLEKGREREKNINVWLPLARPLLVTCLQPRHVP